MLLVLTSLAAILFAVLINTFLVPNVLKLTTAAGHALIPQSSREAASTAALLPPFLAMLNMLLAWAFVCFAGANWLAGEEIGNRWILLLLAGGLSVGPYLLYRRMVASGGIAHRLVGPLHSAFEYAGGIQSQVIVAVMASGIFFDWWEHLPG